MYSLLNLLSSTTKMHSHEYVNLEANVSKNTFINKDQSYSTFMEIKGATTSMGASELSSFVEDLNLYMRANLRKKGYRVQFVFERNPEKSHLDVKKNFDPILKNLDRLGVKNLAGITKSRAKTIAKSVSFEKCYIVITTMTSVLSSSELKDRLEARGEGLKKFGVGIKPGAYSQSNLSLIPELLSKHNAFCRQIFKKLSSKISLRFLSCHEAIKAIMMLMNNHNVHQNMMPSLLGDTIRPRLVSDNPNSLDQSHILNMDIGFQLFNKIPQIPREEITSVKYGDLFYKPLNLDLPPTTILPFSDLFNDIDDDIPWRISIVIESGHDDILKKISTKKTWSSILAITNSVNKSIRKAAEEFLKLCDNQQEETLVSVKVAVMTWGSSLEDLSKRTNSLTESIQGWGGGNAIEEIGDPIELWTNLVPGMARNYISTGFPLFLDEAFTITPISRPTSPWDIGSMVYRTYDKKAFPQQPMSSKQTSWTDLYYAPPGSGKSFKLAADNLSLILNPSNTMLPRITMIDIGFSSAAFVNFVKSCLPEDKKHLAESFRLEMSKDSSSNINVFDTMLGCRKPLALEREFLVNFLSTLFTPASGGNPPQLLHEVCGPLVDAMYEHLSDDGEPNIYQAELLPEVDKALLETVGTIPDYMTWWQVVDTLFDAGKITEASNAQRYAVPVLTDITTVISASKNLKSVFGGSDGDESDILKFIKTMTVSAISDYPILAQPSSFDTGLARIVSIDLSAVTPKGDGAAKKKTGIMYMAARNLCKDFYRSKEDTIEQVNEKYKEYHLKKMQAEANTLKRVCFDEYHRTNGISGIQQQVMLDVREGRKFNVSVALLSQSIEDFSEDLISLADNIYILSKGKTQATIQEIERIFAPNKDSIERLKQYVTGPDPDSGTPMLYIGSLKNNNPSRVEQIIYLTLGTEELWAYTTVREDYLLREALSERVGVMKALEILCSLFPQGSAKEYINSHRDDFDEDESSDINGELSQKITRIFNERKMLTIH